jgi:hypothetical protein
MSNRVCVCSQVQSLLDSVGPPTWELAKEHAAMNMPPPGFGTPEAIQLHNAIARDLELAMQALDRIKLNQAILSPARKLPFDILSIIFSLLGPFPFSDRERMRALIALTHVSRHWRQCALTDPSLWATIANNGLPEGYPNREHHLGWTGWGEPIRIWMSRSRESPLAIWLDDQYDVPHMLSRIIRSKTRVRELWLRESLHLPGPFGFFSVMVATAPYLVTWKFQSFGNAVVDGLMVLPRLKTLLLDNPARISSLRTPNLEELVLDFSQHHAAHGPFTNPRWRVDRPGPHLLQWLVGLGAIKLRRVEIMNMELANHFEMPMTGTDMPFSYLEDISFHSFYSPLISFEDGQQIPRWFLQHAITPVRLEVELRFMTYDIPPSPTVSELVLRDVGAKEDIEEVVRKEADRVPSALEKLPGLKTIEMPIPCASCEHCAWALMNSCAEGACPLLTKFSFTRNLKYRNDRNTSIRFSRLISFLNQQSRYGELDDGPDLPRFRFIKETENTSNDFSGAGIGGKEMRWIINN